MAKTAAQLFGDWGAEVKKYSTALATYGAGSATANAALAEASKAQKANDTQKAKEDKAAGR